MITFALKSQIGLVLYPIGQWIRQPPDRPLGGSARSQLSTLSLSVTRPLLSERPAMTAGSGRMITKQIRRGLGLHGGLCPILGADWERRFTVSCGQAP